MRCLRLRKVGWTILIVIFLVIIGAFIGFVVYFALSRDGEDDYIQITIRDGILEGRYLYTAKNTKYKSFENVPFAAPPIGELRFKDPVPAESWTTIRDASSKGHPCIQLSPENFGELIGNEDCLVLDVYAPDTDLQTLLPVIMHVGGGGFQSTTSVIFNRPEHLMDENVVFVSINYRLGVLGFLSLNTEDVPGNAGIKDQVMALRWIKDNIEFFGGDPNLVTAIGDSAGGGSTSCLQVSPMARGLIQRVISMSATSLTEIVIEEDPATAANLLVTNLGLDPSDDNILERLQAFPADTIIQQGMNVMSVLGLSWRPVVERQFANKEAFLLMMPLEYYLSGSFSHIPTMIGYTSYEYAYFYNPNADPFLGNSFDFLVRPKWNLTSNSDLYNEVQTRIKEFYLGSEEYDPDNREMLVGGIHLMGDNMFVREINEAAILIGQLNQQSVYYYKLSYKGDILGDDSTRTLNLDGSTHGDELHYLFGLQNLVVAEDSRDYITRRRLLKLFTNFALLGNPTPEIDSPLLPNIWIPVTQDTVNYLNIGDDLIPGVNPDGDRMDFWRNLDEYVTNQQTSSP